MSNESYWDCLLFRQMLEEPLSLTDKCSIRTGAKLSPRHRSNGNSMKAVFRLIITITLLSCGCGLQSCTVIGYFIGLHNDQEAPHEQAYNADKPEEIIGRRVIITAETDPTRLLDWDRCVGVAYYNDSNTRVGILRTPVKYWSGYMNLMEDSMRSAIIGSPIPLHSIPLFNNATATEAVRRKEFYRIVGIETPITSRIIWTSAGAFLDGLGLYFFLHISQAIRANGSA